MTLPERSKTAKRKWRTCKTAGPLWYFSELVAKELSLYGIQACFAHYDFGLSSECVAVLPPRHVDVFSAGFEQFLTLCASVVAQKAGKKRPVRYIVDRIDGGFRLRLLGLHEIANGYVRSVSDEDFSR